MTTQSKRAASNGSARSARSTVRSTGKRARAMRSSTAGDRPRSTSDRAPVTAARPVRVVLEVARVRRLVTIASPRLLGAPSARLSRLAAPAGPCRPQGRAGGSPVRAGPRRHHARLVVHHLPVVLHALHVLMHRGVGRRPSLRSRGARSASPPSPSASRRAASGAARPGRAWAAPRPGAAGPRAIRPAMAMAARTVRWDMARPPRRATARGVPARGALSGEVPGAEARRGSRGYGRPITPRTRGRCARSGAGSSRGSPRAAAGRAGCADAVHHERRHLLDGDHAARHLRRPRSSGSAALSGPP